MTGMEIWESIFRPVFQFLVGPILTGIVIFKLTNNAAKKREQNNATRQLNVLKAKLERIITLVEAVNEKLEEDEDYSERLREMSLGDFSAVKEEVQFSHRGSEEDLLRLYKSLKKEGERKVLKLSGKIEEVALELKSIPTDALPTKIHGKLHELIETQEIDLDLTEIKSLTKLVQLEI